MRPIWFVMIGVGAVLLPLAAFVAMPVAGPPADAVADRREATTQAGLYRIAIAPEQEPVRQGELHAWIVTITTPAGEAVEGATVAMDGGMRQHNHGLPTAPAMTASLGDGRYRIEGVKFSMPGRWQLVLTVDAPAGRDAAEFEIGM